MGSTVGNRYEPLGCQCPLPCCESQSLQPFFLLPVAEPCLKGKYLHYLIVQNRSLCQHSHLGETPSPCTSPITNPGGFLTLLFSSAPSKQHHWVWGAELHLSEHPITRGLAGKLRAGEKELDKFPEREDSSPSKLKEIPQESQLLIKNLSKK